MVAWVTRDPISKDKGVPSFIVSARKGLDFTGVFRPGVQGLRRHPDSKGGRTLKGKLNRPPQIQ